MPEVYIGAIALAPIVVAVVQLAKRFGLPTNYAPYLNAVLSVAFYALAVFLVAQPEYLETVNIVLNGFVVFLAAAGVYDRTQGIITRE